MMIPITRKEKYINEIVGGGNTAPETPQTREEIFFADILGEVVAPSPITRAEKYLAKIANKYNGELPEPVTRIERFLARAAGMNVSIPTPVTREEIFWAAYAGVEIEIEGVPPLMFKSYGANLSNYRIYGNTVNGESVGDLVESGEHAGEYLVPVTINSNTTSIYLPYQIRKVGDELEHIDYEEQKQHRVRKNLLQNMAVSKQIGNVIFTVLTDGTVTCEISDGNPASQSIGFVISSNGIFEAGAYKISGCPTGGGSNYKMIAIFDVDGQQVSAVDTGQGVTVELGSDAQIERNGFYIAIYIGAVFDRLVFSPMIRKVDITDNTYEPYIENTELDVTLPALPTLSGTNTLTVGTEVQPSEVYIKYEGAR